MMCGVQMGLGEDLQDSGLSMNLDLEGHRRRNNGLPRSNGILGSTNLSIILKIININYL